VVEEAGAPETNCPFLRSHPPERSASGIASAGISTISRASTPSDSKRLGSENAPNQGRAAVDGKPEQPLWAGYATVIA
jgi:hypothetical protein